MFKVKDLELRVYYLLINVKSLGIKEKMFLSFC